MASIFVLNTGRSPMALEPNPVRMFDREGRDYAGNYLASEWKNLGLTTATLLSRAGHVEYVAKGPSHLARVMTHLSAVELVNRRIEGLTPSERERYTEELDVASIGGGCGFWEMPKTARKVLDRIYQQREREQPKVATARNPPDPHHQWSPFMAVTWRCLRGCKGTVTVRNLANMDLLPSQPCPTCGGTEWIEEERVRELHWDNYAGVKPTPTKTPPLAEVAQINSTPIHNPKPPKAPKPLEGSWVDELTDFPPRVTLRWRCRKDGGATHVHGRKGMDLRPMMKCPNCGGTDWYVDKSTTRKEDGTVKVKFWGKPLRRAAPKIVAYGTPRGGRDWTRLTPEMLQGTTSKQAPPVDAVTTKEELAESLRKKFVPGRKFATWEEIAAHAVSSLVAGGRVAIGADGKTFVDVRTTLNRADADAAGSRQATKELHAVRAQLVKKAGKLKEVVGLLRRTVDTSTVSDLRCTCQRWLADYDKDPER